VDEDWVRDKVNGDGDGSSGDDGSGDGDGSGNEDDEAIEDRYEPPTPPAPYPVTNIFEEGFLANFWDSSRSGAKGSSVTDEMLYEVEQKLGFKLPASYIELIRSQNGGCPRLTGYRVENTPSLKRVDIEELLGCDKEVDSSLTGTGGSEFMMDEWEYPRIGLYFGNCPSGGHDMICLDYRKCGVAGEPEVAHLDQELDFRKVVIAPNFETFVRKLVSDDELEEE
jgi:hypothetical protein